MEEVIERERERQTETDSQMVVDSRTYNGCYSRRVSLRLCSFQWQWVCRWLWWRLASPRAASPKWKCGKLTIDCCVFAHSPALYFSVSLPLLFPSCCFYTVFLFPFNTHAHTHTHTHVLHWFGLFLVVINLFCRNILFFYIFFHFRHFQAVLHDWRFIILTFSPYSFFFLFIISVAFLDCFEENKVIYSRPLFRRVCLCAVTRLVYSLRRPYV